MSDEKTTNIAPELPPFDAGYRIGRQDGALYGLSAGSDAPDMITRRGEYYRAQLAPPEPRWQPIATAPKSTTKATLHGHNVRGSYFLAYCPDESVNDPKACICVCWWEPHMDDGKGRWQGEGDFPLRPTHWMPLPEPPEKR